MSRISSCRYCESRYEACHDSCPKYLAEKKADLEAKKRYKEKNLGNLQLHQIASERKAKKIRKKK